jgi:RuvB-like protein 1 (pontin 52)
MLDLECFTYLNRALESSLSPIVVLATNRGVCTIRGSDGISAPHGIPLDLLDRLLIIRTSPYSFSEIRTILQTRAQVESLEVTGETFDKLAQIGVDSTLRYAIQLLTPASVLCKINGRDQVIPEDVDEVHGLFLDAKASAQILQESKSFIL